MALPHMTRAELRDLIDKKFPGEFGLHGFPGEVFRVSRTSSYVNDYGRVVYYTERRMPNGKWADFAKGSESELRSQMTSLRTLQANAPANWVPWAVGGAVLAAWWLFSGTSSGASGGGGPTLTPVTGSCPVDPKNFDAWLIEKQLAGNVAPVTLPFPTSYDMLVSLKLAPADLQFGVPFVLVLGNGEFWYYQTKKTAPVKSTKLMNEYCTFAKSLAGALRGHPADYFMVG
jgi:hypothetical protein